MAGTQIATGLVADPAVFADKVFENLGKPPVAKTKVAKPIVGLVVTRGGIFADNGIDFTEGDQREFWLGAIRLLEDRGYDYRLFTTGHFTDEIFLDSLVRHHGVPAKNVTFTVNSPDELIQELRKCDSVIAYRLHASITCFRIGNSLCWSFMKFKVPEFYREIGYPERAIDSTNWNPLHVVTAMETALKSEVKKEEGYLYTVYKALYDGVKEAIALDDSSTAYSLEEVFDVLPRSVKTSQREYRAKVQRKLRRSYELYANRSKAETKGASKRVSLLRGVLRRIKQTLR